MMIKYVKIALIVCIRKKMKNKIGIIKKNSMNEFSVPE